MAMSKPSDMKVAALSFGIICEYMYMGAIARASPAMFEYMPIMA